MRNTSTGVALGILALAFAAKASAAESCSCLADFDRLTAKLEANYVAFALEYDEPTKKAAYEAEKRTLRQAAETARGADCLFTLRRLTSFFRDGHLFLQDAPSPDDAEAARLAATAENFPRPVEEVVAQLAREGTKLDPIEGIWIDKDGYRVAIVRDARPGRRDFAAVMLSDDVPRWKRGQVKAEFTAREGGTYGATVYTARHAARHPTTGRPASAGAGAELSRGVLLAMPPYVWGKQSPLGPHEAGTVDPRDPRAPVWRTLENGVVVLHLPSHSPEYRGQLEGLVVAHRAELEKAPLLVIDLRGDEGGSTGTTGVLEPFLGEVTSKSEEAGWDERAVVLSSPDNLAYFRQMAPQGWIPAALVARMEAAPGRVVAFADAKSDSKRDSKNNTEPEEATDAAPVPPGPRRVAIVIDGSVVSAGEAFVLRARRHSRVTLYGRRTAGVIDYQNVTMIDLACPERGLLFGYPTLAASAALPEGGINGIGIAPDVEIGEEVADPIGFVVARELERRP